MTEQSPAPLTRRQLREAGTPTGRPMRTPAPERPTTTLSAPTPGPVPSHSRVAGAQPLTRRAIREAERAACPPPFAALVRLPLPTMPRLGGGALAKSGLLVALSGALVVTSISGMRADAAADLDGLALRAQADRVAMERAQEVAARERADAAASTRLSAAAAAYATVKRAEAVRAAQETLEAATVVSSEVEPVVDEATLTRLTAAAAELEALVQQIEAPRVRLADVTQQAVAVANGAATPAGTAGSDSTGPDSAASDPAGSSGTTAAESAETDEPSESAAPGTTAESADSTDLSDLSRTSASAAAPRVPGPDASTRSDGPASRATRSAAPIVQAPDNQAPNGQAPNSQAPNGEAPSDAVTAAPPSATDAPSSGPAGPAPMQLTADPNHLAAEAALALEHVDFLMDAAAQVEAAVAEANETAAAVIAQQEAERKAAEERARKIAVAVDSANGAIPRDVLCAPAFAPDALLRCDAAEALDRLNAAYRADHGRDLRVVSSYRSYAMQVSTKASRGSLAARPGTSNHGRGIAVDLGGFGSVGQFNDPDYLWMREHAGEFGWYHPAIMRPGGGGPQEPWHWEYGTD